MSNGDLFPSPTHALPADSGGQDRSRANFIHSEIDPGAVGAGRVWVVDSTGTARERNADNTAWVSFGGTGTVPAFGGSGDIVAEAIGSTVSAGATGKIADAAHRHAMPAAGAPAAETIGATVVTGAVGTFADSGHRHAMPAAGAPAAEALGSTVVTGAVGTFADSGHVHAMPAKSVAIPRVESGTGAAGTSANPSLDDHVHPAAGTLAIVNQKIVLTGGSIAIASGATADILSLALGIGTWLVFANCNISADTGVGAGTGKIWDGATIYGVGDSAIAAASYRIQMTVISIPIVLAAPTTIKWTITSQSPISAIHVNDVSPNATDPAPGVTSLVAIQLA